MHLSLHSYTPAVFVAVIMLVQFRYKSHCIKLDYILILLYKPILEYEGIILYKMHHLHKVTVFRFMLHSNDKKKDASLVNDDDHQLHMNMLLHVF